ncbi:hypothetical protein [Roseiarcus sp.]
MGVAQTVPLGSMGFEAEERLGLSERDFSHCAAFERRGIHL